jgi:acyl carrier protein
VLDDGVFSSLTPERFRHVFLAKASGAQHLDELTRDRDLDAFVLFSSVSATMGNPGQANYAAANAFLDGLAGQRRAAGLAATSIAWGPWADGGMAAAVGCLSGQESTAVGRLSGQESTAGRRLRRGGVTALAPGSAVVALERALGGQALGRGDPCMVIADIDWDRFLPAVAAARPHRLFDSLPEASRGQRGNRGAETSARMPDAEKLRGRLPGLSEADRDRTLLDLVRGQAAMVLGHASAKEVEVKRSFMDVGFDSLTSIELRNGLAAATGLRMPPTVVFDHPTPAALAAYLKSELTGTTPPPGEPVTGRPEAGLPAQTHDDLARAETLEDMLGIIEAELQRQ